MDKMVVGMSMTVRLNKPVDPKKIFPQFGSVGMIVEDKEIPFDFQDVHAFVDGDKSDLIFLEYETALVESFPEMATVDPDTIEGVGEVFYSLEAEDKDVRPVEITELSLIVEEPLPEEFKSVAPKECEISIANVGFDRSLLKSATFLCVE